MFNHTRHKINTSDYFSRDDFSLVISDESHRSLGGQSKKVFDLHFLWLMIEY